MKATRTAKLIDFESLREVAECLRTLAQLELVGVVKNGQLSRRTIRTERKT